MVGQAPSRSYAAFRRSAGLLLAMFHVKQHPCAPPAAGPGLLAQRYQTRPDPRARPMSVTRSRLPHPGTTSAIGRGPHSRPGSAAYIAAASKDSGSKRQPKPVSPKPSPPMTDRCDQFPARTTGRRVCGGPSPRHRPSRHTGGDRTALHAEVGPRGPGDSLLVLRRPSSSWSIQRVVDPEHCARQLRSVHPSSSQPHRRPLVTPLQASHGSRLGLESTSQGSSGVARQPESPAGKAVVAVLGSVHAQDPEPTDSVGCRATRAGKEGPGWAVACSRETAHAAHRVGLASD